MINIFISYGFDDNISSLISELSQKKDSYNKVTQPNYPKADFDSVKLEKTTGNWRLESRNTIMNSQIVILALGKKGISSSNVEWEANIAANYHKLIIYYPLTDDIEPPNWLNQIPVIHAQNIHDILNVIYSFNRGSYDLFNNDISRIISNESDRSNLFEQYKVYLDTSEKLVERRQKVNNFYITANSIVVAFIGTLLSFNMDHLYRMAAVLLLCFVGIMINYSWNNILTTYGILNKSKMAIISMIEKYLPANLYDAEYKCMKTDKKYVSFTKSEKKLPLSFGLMFILCAVLFLFLLYKSSGSSILQLLIEK